MRLVSRDCVELDMHELEEKIEKARQAKEHDKAAIMMKLFNGIYEYCSLYESGGLANLDKMNVELPKKIYINKDSLMLFGFDISSLPISEESILNAYAIAAYTRNYEMLEKMRNLFSLETCLPSQIEDDVKEYIFRNGVNIKEYLFGQKRRTIFLGNYSAIYASEQFLFNEPVDKVNSDGLEVKPVIPISIENNRNQLPRVFDNKGFAKFFRVVNKKYAAVQKSDIVHEGISIKEIHRLNCSPYISRLFKLMLVDDIDKVYVSLNDSTFKSLGFEISELPLSCDACLDLLEVDTEPEIYEKLFMAAFLDKTNQKEIGKDVLDTFFRYASEIKEGYFYDGSTIKYRNLDEEQKGNKVNKIFPPHQPLGK